MFTSLIFVKEVNRRKRTQGGTLANPQFSFPPRRLPGSEKGMVCANFDASCQKVRHEAGLHYFC